MTFSLWIRARARESMHWPSVMGVITESRIDQTHLETTKPVLRYRYEVSGQTYIGFRAAFSGYGVSRADMQAVIQPYAVGSSVRVFYDPQRPASAVLNNASPSDWLYWLLFGCGFLLLAAYLIL